MKKLKALQITPYLIMLVLMVLVIGSKKNFHVDETYSYGLSNNVGSISIEYEDGVTYTPADEVYLNYLTVDAENRFNYKNVWDNQTADVHPPLYYTVLHTVCSLFPETFSIWYAGIINIVFMLLTFYFANKIIGLLIDDAKYKTLFSLTFALSAGLLSAASFFRMYILAMFFCTALLYLVLQENMRGGGIKRSSLSYYVKLWFLSVLGALTHYYCIMYLVFLCIALGIFLIIKKEWKKLGLTVITEALAGGMSILMFPAMLTHMFSGYRGTQSISNLQGTKEEFWNRIKTYFQFFEKELFGGYLIYIVIFAVIAFLLWFICGKVKISLTDNVKKQLCYILLIALPIILYFLFVSKSAAYLTDRYVYPIYAASIILVFYLVYNMMGFWVSEKNKLLIMIVLVTVFTVNGWKNTGWDYLYTSSQDLLDKAEEFADTDCIVIYDAKWKTQSAYYEISNYKSVTFISTGNLAMIDSLDFLDDSELIVLLIDNDTATLDKIIAKYPLLDKYEKIGGYAYTTTYRLYGSEKNMQSYKIKSYSKDKYLGSVWDDEQSVTDIALQDNETVVRALDIGDEYYELWLGHYVFDIQGGSFANGTNVRAFSSNSTAAQKWKLVENQDGSYIIEASDSNYALTFDDAGNVFISEKDGSDYQKWWLE